MAHFRGALSLSFKARPGAQPRLIWIKSYFQMKGWTPRLSLRKRLKVIRSEILLERQLNLLLYFPSPYV